MGVLEWMDGWNGWMVGVKAGARHVGFGWSPHHHPTTCTHNALGSFPPLLRLLFSKPPPQLCREEKERLEEERRLRDQELADSPHLAQLYHRRSGACVRVWVWVWVWVFVGLVSQARTHARTHANKQRRRSTTHPHPSIRVCSALFCSVTPWQARRRRSWGCHWTPGCTTSSPAAGSRPGATTSGACVGRDG
jgi:hypothetical protein